MSASDGSKSAIDAATPKSARIARPPRRAVLTGTDVRMAGHIDAPNADIPDWDKMSRVRVGCPRKQPRSRFGS